MSNYFIKSPNITGFEIEYYLSENNTRYTAGVFPPHIHDTLEVYVLLEGNASFMVEHNIYDIEPLDIIISKPNEIHNCILNSESVHKHLCFWFNPSSEFLFSALTSPKSSNFISPLKEDKDKLKTLFYELNKASKEKDTLLEFTLATQFIYYLNKYSNEKPNKSQIPENLRKILDEINKNFIEIRSINYISEKYFISHSQLCRLFKRYLHTSPKLYLETKRLAHSRILLKQGKSVIDACMESGFSDYSNFIRLFKTRFGITPRKYKEG